MARTRFRARGRPWERYFITCGTVDWTNLFVNDVMRSILTESLKYLAERGDLAIHAYAILLNHLHAICSAADLNRQMRRFMSYTARRVVDQLSTEKNDRLLERLRNARRPHMVQQTHQVWEQGFHPKYVRDQRVLQQKLDYIHLNPVRHGLVTRPEDWEFSSCQVYFGLREEDRYIPLEPL